MRGAAVVEVDLVRIVGGEFRGRTLRAPRGAQTRPTSEKVREAIFNVLGQRLDGEVVLDLYAGSGALGLEALSRGAARAVLVDDGAEAASVARANAEALGLLGARCEVRRAKVERAIENSARSGELYSLIFADPPYGAEVVGALAARIDAANILGAGGRLVCEHGRRESPAAGSGRLALEDRRRYGDTMVSFFRNQS